MNRLRLAGAAPLIAALACSVPVPPPAAAGPGEVRYRIVVTGSEILDGAYPDAHTCFLTRTLRPLGLRCAGSAVVEDRIEEIRAALRSAAEGVPLVLVTGGLGPTDNDVTREALSAFTGIPLREDPGLVEDLRRRFGGPSGTLRANLRRQARVPSSGTYLRNAHGTAPGLVFEEKGRMIVALPGPPRELQPMVRDELVPYLARRFGIRPRGCALRIRFIGLGQSQIDETLKRQAPPPEDALLFSDFEGGRVDFTFVLPEDTPRARARLEEFKERVLGCLGDHIYAVGEETLEQVVAGRLRGRGTRLALAEAGTGGALAAALTGGEASGEVLAGAWTAPDEDRLGRMLKVPEEAWKGEASPEGRAGLLAAAAAAAAGGGCWAVAVGTPRSEGGPASPRVPVVYRSPEGAVSIERAPARDRSRLVTHVLDGLRRRLK